MASSVFPKTGFAASGEVVYKHRSCDYFIVSTGSDYALLEWYGGYDPDVEDTLVGGYESYGFKDIYDTTAEQDVRVWVEDYWLSRSRVIEKYQDKCDGRYPVFNTYRYYVPPAPVRTSCALYGSNAIPTLDGNCVCGLGYEWNTGITQCVQTLTCTDGYIKKNNQCLTYTQDCQQTFGANSFGKKSNSATNSECFCNAGYVWNSAGTTCVLGSSTCQSNTTFSIAKNACISLNQMCSDSFGQSSISNGTKNSTGDAVCICKEGFTWSADRTQCVALPTPTPSASAPTNLDMQQFCISSLGQDATFDSVTGNCQCRSGFEKRENACKPIIAAFSGIPKTKSDLLRCSFVGNKTNKLYYAKGHKTVAKMTLTGKTCFAKEADAQKAGYRRSK